MLYLPPMVHQTPLRFLLCLLALALPRALGSHEVPARVAIIAFVAPDAAAGKLTLAVRVPLEAMRDLEFPLHADGSLDVAAVTALLPEAARLWVAGYLTVWQDGRALGDARVVATRVSLPSDRSFETYESARAHLAAPTRAEEMAGLRWQQAMFDLELEYSIASAESSSRSLFAIEPRLAHLGVRTTTVMRLQLPERGERVFTYTGDPGRIELDPGIAHAAGRFVAEGFRHILGGIDHLLFILCLVLPVRRWRPLVAIVTAFTLAHSLTLGAAALGVVPSALWFPPFVEALIALSIVWLAIENVLLSSDRLERRWRMAFGFGLIHGFGFSFALGEQLQFAGRHLVTSLAAFYVGVELGQLLVLTAAVPALVIVRRYVRRSFAHADASVRADAVTIVGSVLVAHVAWHWMTERFATLGEFRGSFSLPALDATFALGAMRAALLAAVAVAVALAMQQILRAVPWLGDGAGTGAARATTDDA